MSNFFRKAAALTALLAVAAQPLGAWAYAPTLDLVVRTGVPATDAANQEFNSCLKEALALKDAKLRDETARPYCYGVYGKAVSAALNDSQEAGLSLSYIASIGQKSEGGLDSVLLLRALRQAQDFQKLAKQALDRRLAIGNGDGTPIAKLDALKAEQASAQKAGSGALAKTLDAKIAFLTKAKTLRDASDAASKKVVEALAKFGYSVTSPSDLSQTQALIDRELKLGLKFNLRALLIAINQSVAEPDIVAKKAFNYVVNNPGKIAKAGGTAIVSLGKKLILCAASIQSTAKCAKAVADGFVESIATNAKVLVFQQDLQGNPVSDEEWGKALLMAPLIYLPMLPAGKLGAVADVRLATKSALTAKLGEEAAENFVKVATRATGEAQTQAQAVIKNALKDSKDSLGKVVAQAEKNTGKAVVPAAVKEPTFAESYADYLKNPSDFGARPSVGAAVVGTIGNTVVREYSTARKLLVIQGQYVLRYSDYRKLYAFDGKYLVDYATRRKLAFVDGNYVLRYTDYRKVAKLDGKYVLRYADNRKFATIEGGSQDFLAAAVHLLLNQ